MDKYGYKAGILPCVLFGSAMFPQAVYSPAEAMKQVAAQRITVFPGAPTIFQTILDDPARESLDLSSLRLVVTGAAIVPVVPPFTAIMLAIPPVVIGERRGAKGQGGDRRGGQCESGLHGWASLSRSMPHSHRFALARS